MHQPGLEPDAMHIGRMGQILQSYDTVDIFYQWPQSGS